MKKIYLVDGLRTAFGRFGGKLKSTPSADLSAFVINELLKKLNLKGEELDEFNLGMCVPSETGIVGAVPARQVILKAGLPQSLVSMTLDRACCSSLTAVQLAWRAIMLDEADIILAGGVDNLSRTPITIPELRWGSKIGDVKLRDHLYQLGYEGVNPVTIDAGNVALEEGISREMQDEWAYNTQMKYQKAKEAGVFKDEIIPYPIKQRRGDPIMFEEDEFPKPTTTLEGLAKLPTVYGSPTVTAGNAPGLDTGAVALIIASEDAVKKHNWQPLAEIMSVTSVALPANDLARAPAPAIKKAIDKAGVGIDSLDLIEINEAFAAMPLVATKILSEGNEERLKRLREITNVNGGAIAIGHPVGASGARILLTLAKELKRRGGGKGVASICGGLAQGDAAVINI